MTPEVQAYIDQQFALQQAHIDAKFAENFRNQWALVWALFGILVSKILIWRQMVGIIREQAIQHSRQDDTSRKQDETTRKLEAGTETITKKVEEVPEKVAAIAAQVAVEVAGAASAGDGDLRKPPGL